MEIATMSKLKILTVALVPALGLALVAGAQQPDPKPGQKPEPTPRAGPGDVTKTHMPGKLMIHRGDDVLGKEVINPQGENLGQIKDLVVQPNGQIAYAVLSFGGFLGLGDKLFAVPFEALRLDPEKEHFVLNVTKERLEQAPGFDKDDWPSTSDRTWGRGIHEFYGFEPYWNRS
jgi:sporulation protein YlmC with PRC-barrel domain